MMLDTRLRQRLPNDVVQTCMTEERGEGGGRGFVGPGDSGGGEGGGGGG